MPTQNTPTVSRRAPKAAALASFLAGTVCVGGIAGAAEPTTAELLEQIEALQAQVEKMQADETKADAPDAVAAALADAKARSAGPLLLQVDDPDPFTAGHNGKFLLQSDDGLFSLNPNFQLQVRHVANFAPEDGDAFEDFDFGWEIRRFKVGFKGNAFSEDLTYDFKFAFERSGGDAVLENAFIDYTPENGVLFGDGWGFRIGQYKDPTFFEESTSSSKQMAVDRSLVNETLGGGITDYVQGAGLIYKGDKFKALFAYVDGAGTANTNFSDAGDLRAGFSARADWLLSGTDDDAFGDFTALETEETASRIGAGAFIDLNELDDDVDGDFAYLLLATVDYGLETATGGSLFVAGYLRHVDNGLNDDAGFDSTDFGAEVQYAQVLDQEAGWEVFGRYDFIILDEDIVFDEGGNGEDFFHEFTVGVNKYWVDHKVKMTIDASYLFNGNPGGNSGLGYRSQTDDEGQATIRGQFQLLL